MPSSSFPLLTSAPFEDGDVGVLLQDAHALHVLLHLERRPKQNVEALGAQRGAERVRPGGS